jgi:hypothetical protein
MAHDIAIREIRLPSVPHVVEVLRVDAAGEVLRTTDRAFLGASNGRRIHNLSHAEPYITRL